MLRTTLCATLGLAIFSPQVFAQTVRVTDGRAGLPYDWSHRHVVFPDPATEALRQQLDADPRYAQQVLRRTMKQFRPEDAGSGSGTSDSGTANLASGWTESVGTTAYTLTSPTYPAQYSFNAATPVPSCANDYVVYTLPTSDANSFNVIAFGNLYKGLCTGAAPSVLFAYNGSQGGGELSTAPVLSIDGSEIAFIEKSGNAQFHVLKWHAGDKPSTFPRPFNAAHLPNCVASKGVAPCEYSLTYSSATSTLGSPYVDYATDTAYVTDDKGSLYAISPVFTATPAKPPAVVAGYPVSVGKNALTAPVFDTVSGNVFVSDTSNLYYVRTKAASAGSCASGSVPCVGKLNVEISTGSGMGTTREAPIVDSTNGTVFVFGYSGEPYKGDVIVQSNTTLSVRNVANIGGPGGSIRSAVYAGTFDNAYYTNPTSGKLYACGENGKGRIGTLWAAGFTSATAIKTGTASFGPLTLMTDSLHPGDAPCSSLTEVYNLTAAKDLLYMGVLSNCAFGGSDDGCVMAFDITQGFPAAPFATFQSSAGSSGIVIDHVAGSLTGSTDIYFLTAQPPVDGLTCSIFTGGTSASGNCAVKLSQTGLK